MSVFYQTFERHAHGEGLKGHSTHYCPGCGHGLVQKYMAEAIEKFDLQDNTVAISPVGCSVFMYYYMDVGNSQAAHGRAPVVALGHKLANPNTTVLCYQGDGDLASIGLAEIMSALQMGIPITYIFVNNAIYGMTGGQMAPTTLMGQKTSTSPEGRVQVMGEPMKMAELVAQLDGPMYVARVALFDVNERARARRAIRKAVKLQKEGRGCSFIEVIAECPTHLKMSPNEAEEWTKTQMTKIFPLGTKKDVKRDPWFTASEPSFQPIELTTLIGGTAEKAPRYMNGAFPTHVAQHDIALKLAGAGGDGAQTAAMLLAYAGTNEGFDATHIPSYGPESRGGTSYADVHIADTEVLSPASPHPHILVAFNAPSLTKFAPEVVDGGTIVYDSSVIADPHHPGRGIKMVGAPFTEIGVSLGKPMVKNIAALGALQAATNLFPHDTLLTAIRSALHDKVAMIPINETAYQRGREAARELGGITV